MYKKLALTGLSFATLLLSEEIEPSDLSVLPTPNETVRCYYDNVAIRINNKIKKPLLNNYRIRLFDFFSFKEIEGKNSVVENVLFFTPAKSFQCDKKFSSILVKKNVKNISKKDLKNLYHWSFQTEKEVKKNFIAHKSKTMSKTPILFNDSLFGKTFEPEILFERKSSTSTIRNLEENETREIPPVSQQDKFKEVAIEKELQEVRKLIHQKKWKEVEDKCLKLFQTNPSSKVSFYLGMAYFNQKKYDDAIGAFERVIISEPNHLVAKLELAKTMYMAKQYDESEKIFKSVKNDFDNLPVNVEKNIDSFLEAIEDTKKKNVVVFIAMGEIKQEKKSETKNAGNEKYNDTLHQEILLLSHSYDFGETGGWKNANSLVAINNHKFLCSGDSESANDAHCRSGIQGAVLSTGISGKTEYGELGFSLTKPFLSIFTNSKNSKKEVKIDGLDFKIDYSYPMKEGWSVGAEYTRKDGTTVMDKLGLADKSAEGHILNTKLTKKFTSHKLTFQYAFQKIKEETEGNPQDYEDKTTKNPSFIDLFALNNRTTLNTELILIDENVDSNLANSNDYNKDGYNINLKASYTLERDLFLTGSFNYEYFKKHFYDALSTKFDEKTRSTTLGIGVTYIFAPINF